MKALFFAVCSLLISPIMLAQNLIQYVDPLIGTANATTESARKHGEGTENKGQTFPAVGRPFGMTQWTPETRATEVKCVSPYYYADKRLTGFRGSHWMNGSCTQDYGSVTLMPFTAAQLDTLKTRPTSRFSHETETAKPDYYKVTLDDFGITAEVTASVRSGILRFTFPKGQAGRIYIHANSDEKQGSVQWNPNQKEVFGYNPAHRIYQGSGQSAGFSGHFVIQFDQSFVISQSKAGPQYVIVTFPEGGTIQARVGTSFTSLQAAKKNLQAELPNWNFEVVRQQTQKVWNETLGKVQVKGGTKDDQVKFYTALYHSYQLPRIASDVDGSYPGFAQDTTTHKAVGFDYYDDFSMWDTYRALHPLMTILEPKRSLHMVKSLVAKAQQGGWMPIFPAWGSYTAAMIGDHASTMIADAYQRGIRDFDTETAYRYMRQNAFDSPTTIEYKDGKGRRALTSYLKYNYIPLEDSVWDAFHKREQVSRTLEYALDDFALSQFAHSLGKTADYEILQKRAQNYRNVFDQQTGYVRGRYADGRWIEPFTPFQKASYICEGTPYHYTWYVPQDIPGLVELMGGKTKFLERLNTFFDGGHYWHGNETDHQAAYLFPYAGQARKTQEWVRRIVREEYGVGPGGITGNEDAGQMSAWLVCSMMGFYPVCPGKPEYVLGSPSFTEIQIQPDAKKKPFVIQAVGNSDSKPYVGSMQLDGKTYTNFVLPHRTIAEGGNLRLLMSK
ncbi:GH92 family glycosyl hydrolase [Tellurirhabdus bombi]|uniref:GH92 family glycosyl hydrolase n=1 Tax=Tellurirhabdus bombi TaxID=2907205 RepID=UPI001F34A5D6|nr:GH92 family glycosyl hydrolase [Tellurirhabdus bombi]